MTDHEISANIVGDLSLLIGAALAPTKPMGVVTHVLWPPTEVGGQPTVMELPEPIFVDIDVTLTEVPS